MLKFADDTLILTQMVRFSTIGHEKLWEKGGKACFQYILFSIKFSSSIFVRVIECCLCRIDSFGHLPRTSVLKDNTSGIFKLQKV